MEEFSESHHTTLRPIIMRIHVHVRGSGESMINSHGAPKSRAKLALLKQSSACSQPRLGCH